MGQHLLRFSSHHHHVNCTRHSDLTSGCFYEPWRQHLQKSLHTHPQKRIQNYNFVSSTEELLSISVFSQIFPAPRECSVLLFSRQQAAFLSYSNVQYYISHTVLFEPYKTVTEVIIFLILQMRKVRFPIVKGLVSGYRPS